MGAGGGESARLCFFPGSEILNHSSHTMSLYLMLGSAVLYAYPSGRTVEHNECACSLISFLSSDCSELQTASCGPASLHYPFISSLIWPIYQPSDDSMCESLRHACVFHRESFVELHCVICCNLQWRIQEALLMLPFL